MVGFFIVYQSVIKKKLKLFGIFKMLPLLCGNKNKKVMGMSELIITILVTLILFNPIAKDGFITGFKEGLKKKK